MDADLARLEERILAVKERATLLDTKLDGFPQIYALRSEIDRVVALLDTIRTDHVQRAEFDNLRGRISEGQGRRTAAVATTAVILLLLSLLFGLLESQRLTSTDVSTQIDRESPWLADKPTIEHRLTQLEADNQTLRLQLADATSRIGQIETLDRFFCRTRTPKLPGC